MHDDELMTIGRFARLSQVSVHTLRHYDEIGLLAPAEIDPASGYRRYRRTQIQSARLIRVLRGLDLPIEEIRPMLSAGAEELRTALAQHRETLARQWRWLAGQIEQVDRFLEEGITVPIVKTGCRPVQTVIPVADREAAVAFYREAFYFPYDVIRRTKHRDHLGFTFGTYGQDDFFLLHPRGPERSDRPAGPATFGLLVDDLDAHHARALSAGASEAVAPHDPEGMPRTSAVRDPGGNLVELTQSWPDFGQRCRPVQIKLAVDDREAAIAFYEKAFGLSYEVIRRTTGGAEHSSFVFGEYGSDGFFLLHLLDDPTRSDRPGPSDLAFLVDDLDAYHKRALAAGATQVASPREAEGMPRGSALRDPSGNTIGLAQG